MNNIDFLQWAGCITGVIGAGLLAVNNRFSGIGFLFFLLSNGFWLVFGFLMHSYGLMVMQLLYSGTSFLGIYRWLMKPSKPSNR